MQMFRVRRRLDAWIDYVTEIEAETAQEAVASAFRLDGELGWREVGREEFWNARFAALDEHGGEIPDTAFTRG